MSLCMLVLLTSALGTTAAQAPEPAASVRSQPVVFLAGDTCVLTDALEVQADDRRGRVTLPRGSALEVTTSDLRFSALRARDVSGMVANEALARVCKIERPTCLVRAPLELQGVGKPKHEGKAFRLQKGGTLQLLKLHDDEHARVRVGQLDAVVALPALLAVCPSLAPALVQAAAARADAPAAGTAKKGARAASE